MRVAHRYSRLPIALALGSLLFALPLRAEHWNQFRGPHGNGQVPEGRELPLSWSEEKNVAWKTAVDGKAWSSPVVWGDQIWLSNASADGKELAALQFDGKTGKQTRKIVVFKIDKPMYCHPYNSYGSPTPVIEEGRLWVHFGSAGTACVDTETGALLWSREDLPCDHFRGPGSSPIVDGDLLYIHFDGFDYQYVVALDKNSGKTVWKKDRSIDYKTNNGDAKKAYGTPTLIEYKGRRQLVSPSAVATIAYNPRNGEELWKVYHGGFNAAARPLFSHGKVIINMEGGLRLLAVRPDGTGDVTQSHIEWTCKKATPTRPSQLVVGDHLYMVTDQGVASCVRMSDGTPVWTHRMGSRHSASPIHSKGRLYFFAEDGKMRVIAADPKEFRLLADNQLDGGCMASPAVLKDALIVRTKTHLYRLEANPLPAKAD